jgi:hypothetical protein
MALGARSYAYSSAVTYAKISPAAIRKYSGAWVQTLIRLEPPLLPGWSS